MEREENRQEFLLKIRMFGNFMISGTGKTLTTKIMRSEMLLRLLTYILSNRRKVLSAQELAEVLWPDDSSDNPVGALKNLMYRLRTILKNNWGDREYILTGRGSYQWNPKIPVLADAEEFDRGCGEWENAGTKAGKLERGIETAKLYRGMFLPELNSEYWVVALSTYYHSRYLSLVKELVLRLEEEKQYARAEELCQDAIHQDALDEQIHCFYMKALIADNKQTLALEHYRETVKLLYDSLGVRPSGELQGIYEELLKQQHQHETDIHVIQEELRQAQRNQGAFLCEYGVFKQLYCVEARSGERLGITVHLVLITLHPTVALKRDSGSYRRLVKDGMERLQQVLCHSLRASDIVCRYSSDQFLVMLPACQYENAVMVMRRTQKNFYDQNKKEKIQIQYSIDEICDRSVTEI